MFWARQEGEKYCGILVVWLYVEGESFRRES